MVVAGQTHCVFFFFSSRRRHTRYWRDWSSDVCSSPAFVRRAGALAREIGADVLHVDRERLAPWLSEIPAPKVLDAADAITPDRKSTRLNSSHANISYAVFCLQKKT